MPLRAGKTVLRLSASDLASSHYCRVVGASWRWLAGRGKAPPAIDIGVKRRTAVQCRFTINAKTVKTPKLN
jgi:hypothetical protein